MLQVHRVTLAPPPKMDDLCEELARLAAMPAALLRIEWRKLFRTEVPADFSRDLTLRAIAYRLQEQGGGGLAPSHVRLLDRLAEGGGDDATRQLKVGTMLVREYQGERHEVVVLPDGFHWHGTTYAGLSTIARAITGTIWNGPRFFGLRSKHGTKTVKQEVLAAEVSSKPIRPGRRSSVLPSSGSDTTEQTPYQPPYQPPSAEPLP